MVNKESREQERLDDKNDLCMSPHNRKLCDSAVEQGALCTSYELCTCLLQTIRVPNEVTPAQAIVSQWSARSNLWILKPPSTCAQGGGTTNVEVMKRRTITANFGPHLPPPKFSNCYLLGQFAWKILGQTAKKLQIKYHCDQKRYRSVIYFRLISTQPDRKSLKFTRIGVLYFGLLLGAPREPRQLKQ